MELLETRTEEGLQRTQKFVEASKISKVSFLWFFLCFFLSSFLIFQSTNKIKEVQQQEESSPDIIEATVVSSVWTQFFELARRNWRTITRNPLSFRARIGQTIVMALLVFFFFSLLFSLFIYVFLPFTSLITQIIGWNRLWNYWNISSLYFKQSWCIIFCCYGASHAWCDVRPFDMYFFFDFIVF